MSLITDEIRASASEMYRGNDMCQEKSKILLTEMGLPNGLLPLEDMIECGYIKETGFVWLISKKKTEYKFQKINKLVNYGTEVTAVIEPNNIKKLTGVKAKELLVWLTLSEIKNDSKSGSVIFKTPTGLQRTFPVDAFVINEVKKDVKKKEDLVEIAAKIEAVEVKEVQD